MFLDKDFLLNTDTAKKLFHEAAESCPIIDYHCHINPREIYEDRRYDNITQVWLGGDHYKWRLMRSAGVEEKYITGNETSDHDKFVKWAEVLGKGIGNPLYHWSHLELRRFFGYEGILNRKTAEEVWELANEKLRSEGYSVREVLDRYCGYMAVPIYLEAVGQDLPRDEDHATGTEEEEKKEAEKPVNDTHPLWLKAPKECTDEEYKETYRKLFHTFEEPLFWVHLNVDYPFNLKGILYFPRIKKDFGGQEGEIKLFNRQVFVADNIKEVIPEFLMLLKGVIDCPDLPLNVSRSFLQNDGYVKKLSAHITKKVADKLAGLFNTERKQYETYWDDIHPFVKYGCIKDQKFFDLVKDSLLFKTTAGDYLTLEEYRARNQGKAESKIYYTTEASRQAAAVALYTAREIDVVVMDTLIDMYFMSFMEFGSGMKDVQFVRVDADVAGLTEESEEGKDVDPGKMEKLFRDALNDQELSVKIEALSDRTLPVMLTEDEQMRRYKEMSAIYGQDFALPNRYTLVLNRLNPTVQRLAQMEDQDTAGLLCRQLFDLSRLSSRPLEAEDLKNFIARSNELIAKLAEKA